MKIGLIGTGRLGLCFALLMERAGYEVLASDNREEYIKDLRLGVVGTAEPDVHNLLWDSKNIEFTTDNRRVVRESDIIFTFVATPSLDDGSYDVSAVWNVVRDIKEEMTSVANYAKSFVVGCTTNPGDCDKFKEQLPESVDVFYNPEFIAQGTIVKDLINADIVLICGYGHHIPELEKIYYGIQGSKKEPYIHNMSTKAGEIVKIAINTYLTTKISYANMLGQVLYKSGLEDEIADVLRAIGSDSRIGNKYLNFGFGFGGPCFPRDNRAFASYAEEVGVFFNLGETIDNFNGEHTEFLRDYYIDKNPDNLPYCFKYLTYKAGIDILTESRPYDLALELLRDGYKVYCLDDTCKDQIDDRIEFIAAPKEEVCWIDL